MASASTMIDARVLAHDRVGGMTLSASASLIDRPTPFESMRVSTYSRVPSELERLYYKVVVNQMIARRRKLGVSQELLNARLGIADGLIAKWERFDRLPGLFMMTCWAGSLGLALIPVCIEGDNA